VSDVASPAANLTPLHYTWRACTISLPQLGLESRIVVVLRIINLKLPSFKVEYQDPLSSEDTVFPLYQVP
jgi:hypothetical protein